MSEKWKSRMMKGETTDVRFRVFSDHGDITFFSDSFEMPESAREYGRSFLKYNYKNLRLMKETIILNEVEKIT